MILVISNNAFGVISAAEDAAGKDVAENTVMGAFFFVVA